MIKKISKKRFTVICDNCNHDVRDEGYETIYHDEQTAFSNAEASDWLLENDTHICSQCKEILKK